MTGSWCDARLCASCWHRVMCSCESAFTAFRRVLCSVAARFVLPNPLPSCFEGERETCSSLYRGECSTRSCVLLCTPRDCTCARVGAARKCAREPASCRQAHVCVRAARFGCVYRSRPAQGGSNVVLTVQPRIRRDNPLNLSISLGGGKETNRYSPSNGE